MEIDTRLIAGPWLALGWITLLAVVAPAALTAPWKRLGSAEMQHALFGGCVALIALWWIRAGVVPGLGYHFFGVTALTLMFGWQFAVLAALPVLTAGTLTGHGDWAGLGLNALLLFILPAFISWLVHRIARRMLPRTFFIYVFINCYLAAVLAMAAATLAMAGALLAAGAVDPLYLWQDYMPFLPMLLLSEGFINGAAIAVLVATRPGWVWTFDDRHYLQR